MPLPILFGFIVGASLGLTGGGGSIFAVPLLVYGLGLELRRAVALSLAVVGLTALFGAIIQARRGHILWRAGAILGVAGIAAAPLGAFAGEWLGDDVALYLFAGLMVLVGALMLRLPFETSEIPLEWIACRRDQPGAARITWRCVAKLAAAGGLTGVVSGAFGVGGGFLIVPALLVVLRLDLAVALATSLVTIFLIAASGLTANVANLNGADWAIAVPFVGGAAAGMYAGVVLKKHLPAIALKRVFGWAVIGTAAFVFMRTWLE